jgi:hypothetical protein
LGSIVRGEHFKAKRDFIDLEGVSFITGELRKTLSEKL